MNRFSKSLVALLAGVAIAGTAYARPSVFPTGVTIYDPAEAYNGYTLIGEDYGNMYGYVDLKGKGIFADEPLDYSGSYTKVISGNQGLIKLIDMNGNVVNTWKHEPGGKKAFLLPNGNLLSMSQRDQAVYEYNWEGETVWEYKTRLSPHHDMKRLENGNTLILCFETVSADKIAKLPTTETWWGTHERSKIDVRGDTIIEVDPEGKIVWSWQSSDHLDLENYHQGMGLKDWTHGNTVNLLPENKWYDAGDERFKPGNVLFNARHFNQFFIISKETGEIVWESPADFTGGLDGFANPHEPYMIPKGYPGEGNFIIFDNGHQAKEPFRNVHSIVWEIQPDTFEVVWRYLTGPEGGQRFHSIVKGTAYKLPNGNVLISEDMGARAFQVKPDQMHPDGGSIVWEYNSPTGLARTQMYPYDQTPQTRALGQPKEMKVTGPDPLYLKVIPDELRKDGVVMEYNPE